MTEPGARYGSSSHFRGRPREMPRPGRALLRRAACPADRQSVRLDGEAGNVLRAYCSRSNGWRHIVTNDGNPEPSLVCRAANGDPVALKLLLTESRRDLCEHLARRVPADLRSRFDVEDIVQEAHIDVFRNFNRFEPRGPDSFARWVAAIAMNRLRSVIKRHRTLKRGGGPAGGPPTGWNIEDSTLALLDRLAGPGHTPSRSVARWEVVSAVQAALAELPADYQRAVWLVHIEGRPVKAAAEEMGRSERAIHGLCRRGLKLLRSRLQTATRFLSSRD